MVTMVTLSSETIETILCVTLTKSHRKVYDVPEGRSVSIPSPDVCYKTDTWLLDRTLDVS